MNMTFGTFLKEKREKKEITLRKMADKLGCSAPYWRDVEKGYRNPPKYETLLQVSEILGMSTDEKNLMFDLAGAARDYIAPDLCDYIKNRSYVAAALRVARDLDAGEEDWKLIMNILEKQREE